MTVAENLENNFIVVPVYRLNGCSGTVNIGFGG